MNSNVRPDHGPSIILSVFVSGSSFCWSKNLTILGSWRSAFFSTCFLQFSILAILNFWYNGSCQHFQNKGNSISDPLYGTFINGLVSLLPFHCRRLLPSSNPSRCGTFTTRSTIDLYPFAHFILGLRVRNLFHFVDSSTRVGVLVWAYAGLVQNHSFWVLGCRRGADRYPYIWRGNGFVRERAGFILWVEDGMMKITTLTRLKLQFVAGHFQTLAWAKFSQQVRFRLVASVAAFWGFEVLFVAFGQDVTGADGAISWGKHFGGQVRLVGCWGLSHVVSG